MVLLPPCLNSKIALILKFTKVLFICTGSCMVCSAWFCSLSAFCGGPSYLWGQRHVIVGKGPAMVAARVLDTQLLEVESMTQANLRLLSAALSTAVDQDCAVAFNLQICARNLSTCESVLEARVKSKRVGINFLEDAIYQTPCG